MEAKSVGMYWRLSFQPWVCYAAGILQHVLGRECGLTGPRLVKPRSVKRSSTMCSTHLKYYFLVQEVFSQISRSVMSNSLRSHGLQHARLLCPSPTPGAYLNPCPSRQWCHLTIASSVLLLPLQDSKTKWEDIKNKCCRKLFDIFAST